ncbi:Hypothetical protein HDN1F_20600 [gamma proteobacterium HdN1]|nr:Hypothetical protein HDN1F_20600 [gamma proteobacterium HdN1]
MAIAHNDTAAALEKVLLRSFGQMLKHSISNVTWNVSGIKQLADLNYSHCIVLTISSFKFRAMTLLHLNLDQQIKQQIATALGSSTEDLQESAYLDYLLEMSNSFCGNLKRMFQDTCPPLGMSTPNLLDRSSLVFDGIFKVSYETHCRAVGDYSEPALFAASVLISLQDPKDFRLPPAHEIQIEDEDDGAGELEMF